MLFVGRRWVPGQAEADPEREGGVAVLGTGEGEARGLLHKELNSN